MKKIKRRSALRCLSQWASLSALATSGVSATAMGAVVYHHGPGLSFPIQLPGESSIRFLQGGGLGYTDGESFTDGIAHRNAYVATRTQYSQISGVQFGGRYANRGQTFKQVVVGSNVIRVMQHQAFLEENEVAHATTKFPNLSAIRARWLSFVQGLRYTRLSVDMQRIVLDTFSNYQRSAGGNTTSFVAGIDWLVDAYRCWPEGTACGPGGYSDEYELFRFPVGSRLDYGWLELSLTDDPLGGSPQFTPIAYAYDTSGRLIPAGYTGIPEPGQLPLALSALSLGAIGLRELRKHRRKPAAA